MAKAKVEDKDAVRAKVERLRPLFRDLEQQHNVMGVQTAHEKIMEELSKADDDEK